MDYTKIFCVPIKTKPLMDNEKVSSLNITKEDMNRYISVPVYKGDDKKWQ